MEEAMIFHSSSPDQPISPYKTTHKKGAAAAASSGNNGGLRRLSSISRPSENFIPPLNFQNSTPSIGLLPPPTNHQLLIPSFNSTSTFHNSYPPFSIQKRQPPLLPLPISPAKQNLPNQTIHRGLSLPLPSTNNNRKTHNKVHTTPKKSKTISHKRPSGPDPKDLPKDIVPRAFDFLSSGSKNDDGLLKLKLIDGFSGSVAFSIVSPPPSSLPLPTFSLRPKLSCNVEAVAGGGGGGAGIEAGATDNLCRLLRRR